MSLFSHEPFTESFLSGIPTVRYATGKSHTVRTVEYREPQ